MTLEYIPTDAESRPGDGEIDFDTALWSVPGERMKGTLVQKEYGQVHLAPLSTQTLTYLRELQRFSGHYWLLVPGIKRPDTTPISAETINKALKIMGFEGQQTGHGFRGLASTIMNDYHAARPEVIEAQLHHKDPNKVREAYNHAAYLDERRRLMQWWSDYLDQRLVEAYGPGMLLDTVPGSGRLLRNLDHGGSGNVAVSTG